MKLLFIIGIIILVASVTFSILNLKRYKTRELAWKRYILLLVLGLLLGVLSIFVTYPYSEEYKIVGFPFAAAAFQKTEHGWIDYVGTMTPVFMAANFVCWALLPQVLEFCFSLCRRKLNGSK